MDRFGPAPYREPRTLFDAGVPSGLRYYWKSSFLDRPPDDALDIVVDQARRRPSRSSKIFLKFLGGAFSRVPREAMVFDHRRSPFDLLIISQWEHPGDDEINRPCARDTWHSMQPFASALVPGRPIHRQGQATPAASIRYPIQHPAVDTITTMIVSNDLPAIGEAR